MQRIVKRFLLRSQRENKKNEETDVGQIKQDLKMFRFEMHADLKRSRLNSLKSLAVVQTGISLIGNETQKSSNSKKFFNFNSIKADLDDFD